MTLLGRTVKTIPAFAEHLAFADRNTNPGMAAFVTTGMAAFVTTGMATFVTTGMATFVTTGMAAFVTTGMAWHDLSKV